MTIEIGLLLVACATQDVVCHLESCQSWFSFYIKNTFLAFLFVRKIFTLGTAIFLKFRGSGESQADLLLVSFSFVFHYLCFWGTGKSYILENIGLWYSTLYRDITNLRDAKVDVIFFWFFFFWKYGKNTFWKKSVSIAFSVSTNLCSIVEPICK